MKITRIEPIHVSIPFEHGALKPSEGLGTGGRFDILLGGSRPMPASPAGALGDATEARDGFLRVPDGPGLGIEVDVAAIERYRVV